jgi:hypothetical protein
MIQNIIVNQVKSLIRKAIERFSIESNVTKDHIAILIYPSNELGEPKLKILSSMKPIKNIEFEDLATKMQRLTYSGMGFNIGKDTPVWVHNFMVRTAKAKQLPITKPSYFLRIYKDEIIALMLVDGKKTVYNENASDKMDLLANYKISVEDIFNTFKN